MREDSRQAYLGVEACWEWVASGRIPNRVLASGNKNLSLAGFARDSDDEDRHFGY